MVGGVVANWLKLVTVLVPSRYFTPPLTALAGRVWYVTVAMPVKLLEAIDDGTTLIPPSC